MTNDDLANVKVEKARKYSRLLFIIGITLLLAWGIMIYIAFRCEFYRYSCSVLRPLFRKFLIPGLFFIGLLSWVACESLRAYVKVKGNDGSLSGRRLWFVLAVAAFRILFMIAVLLLVFGVVWYIAMLSGYAR